MNAQHSKGPAKGPTTILLAEDDNESNRGMVRLLEHQGYRVLAVTTGQAALEVLEEAEGLSCLVTDLQLPDLDGRDLARMALDRHPDLRVSLITGWDLPAEPAELRSLGIDRVLLKPFPIETLIQWIEGRT